MPAALAAAILATLLLPVASVQSREAGASRYMVPPAPIPQILDAAPTPGILLSPNRAALAMLGRENLPPIEDLARPVLRLAGYRINPVNNGPSEGRLQWLNALSFQDLSTGVVRKVALPQGMRFSFPQWSPDGAQLAFAAEASGGLELWIADRSGLARRLSGPTLNAAFGSPFHWMPDSTALITTVVPAGRGAAPVAPLAPEGPLVQESSGRTAPVRTYQDLLRNPGDVALFVHYFTSQIMRVDGVSGAAQPIGAPALYFGASPSPDGQFLLVTRIKPPFSTNVPARRFPTEISVLDMGGRVVRLLADRPLADDVPPKFDAVVVGPRDPEWRSDAPSTLVWAETQDGGNPDNAVAVRDRVFMQDAPFNAEPRLLAEIGDRFSNIYWGRDDFAILTTRWYDTRSEKTFAVNPSRPGAAVLLHDLNYQDRYNDPGAPVLTTDARGQSVIHFTPDGAAYFAIGAGATAAGEFPFLDRVPVAGGAPARLWRAEMPYYETVAGLLDAGGERLLTRRESASEAPNYFIRPRSGGAPQALTAFPDPAPQFAGITKRLITYQRADGVTLSGTLYLPENYDPARPHPLPTLLWAYPTEFTDPRVAGQVVDEANHFVRPSGISHLFLLTQGYAILDDPSMPIIGLDGAEPNDTYLQQLSASAEAAVNALVEMGVSDRRCIAVGGHSYGAFMTANLLAHTDLFRAGIALSGAYNRTLTPFGFQAEQRPYWKAVETYTKMSPFTYADRIKEPILLMHGEADDNSGTFPIQSERFFAALRGNGATVRYVVLPHEAHGYRARESVGHTLWEMNAWLEQHVRSACPQ